VNYGFTGTRRGMTNFQLDGTRRVLMHGIKTFEVVEVYHGDCVGADEQFDEIAADLGLPRFLLPGNDERYRAHCERRGAIILEPPAPPLARNDRIVFHANIMTATPGEDIEMNRSGTWATIRRTRNAGKKLILLFPDRLKTRA